MNGEHQPGTAEVEDLADRLTGGLSAADPADLGGLVVMAETFAESGCACDPGEHRECLCCQAIDLLAALHGEVAS